MDNMTNISLYVGVAQSLLMLPSFLIDPQNQYFSRGTENFY